MNITKCKYYNDSQTSCTLMIDDLVPASVSIDGVIGPHNDWGYLMDKKHSLYTYFNNHLLQKFPEVKGTIFLPLNSQNYIDKLSGYYIYSKKVDDKDFLEFLNGLKSNFDFAFHGVKHSYKNPSGKLVHECENLLKKDVELIVEETKQFLLRTGLTFDGGKFPGYKYNDIALLILNKLNTKWWALNVDMINRISSKNNINIDKKTGLLSIPTNITGDIFKRELKKESKTKLFLKRTMKNKFYRKPFELIEYMYENGTPITIQEHFQNQTTTGKRQTPNIYDDISSLDMIYSILRPLDVWHTTCSNLAKYYESYTNTIISQSGKDIFSIEYAGLWDKPFLSIKLAKSKLLHLASGKEIKGIYKNGSWIFNNIQTGKYKIL